MDINTHDVIEAASTKWNFIKLHPGLVGGHCIGVDPYYLTYKAHSLGYMPSLILGARKINNSMSKFIVDKAIKAMIREDKRLKNANVLILGITFKEDCPDIRNSKVLDIIREFEEFECSVKVYDHWVDRTDLSIADVNFLDQLPLNSKQYDAIVVAVGHEQFKNITTKEYMGMSNGVPIVIDVKGIVEEPTWRL